MSDSNGYYQSDWNRVESSTIKLLDKLLGNPSRAANPGMTIAIDPTGTTLVLVPASTGPVAGVATQAVVLTLVPGVDQTATFPLLSAIDSVEVYENGAPAGIFYQITGPNTVLCNTGVSATVQVVAFGTPV